MYQEPQLEVQWIDEDVIVSSGNGTPIDILEPDD